MGFHTRKVIEHYIAAANKSPANFSSTALAVEIDRYRRGNAPAGLLLDRQHRAGPRSLGRFRCAEPRLPSSTAAVVGDDGALGLEMNILHLPRLFPAQTWRAALGPTAAVVHLRESVARVSIVQIKSAVSCAPPSEHLEGLTFESAATSSQMTLGRLTR